MKPYYSLNTYAMKNSVGYLMRMCTNLVLPRPGSDMSLRMKHTLAE